MMSPLKGSYETYYALPFGPLVSKTERIESNESVMDLFRFDSFRDIHSNDFPFFDLVPFHIIYGTVSIWHY